jgi:hypothetical protein
MVNKVLNPPILFPSDTSTTCCICIRGVQLQSRQKSRPEKFERDYSEIFKTSISIEKHCSSSPDWINVYKTCSRVKPWMIKPEVGPEKRGQDEKKRIHGQDLKCRFDNRRHPGRGAAGPGL